MPGSALHAEHPLPERRRQGHRVDRRGRARHVDPDAAEEARSGAAGRSAPAAATCACSTCHVWVEQGRDSLPEVDDKENDIIDKAFDVRPESRLGCQATLGDEDVVVEITPESLKAWLDEHPECGASWPADQPPSSPDSMPPFSHTFPVRFADVDHAGIVYYPRFFHYFHAAFEEFFRRRMGGRAYVDLLDRRDRLPGGAQRVRLPRAPAVRRPGPGRHVDRAAGREIDPLSVPALPRRARATGAPGDGELVVRDRAPGRVSRGDGSRSASATARDSR